MHTQCLNKKIIVGRQTIAPFYKIVLFHPISQCVLNFVNLRSRRNSNCIKLISGKLISDVWGCIDVFNQGCWKTIVVLAEFFSLAVGHGTHSSFVLIGGERVTILSALVKNKLCIITNFDALRWFKWNKACLSFVADSRNLACVADRQNRRYTGDLA